MSTEALALSRLVESPLRHKVLLGTVAIRRAGLGAIPQPQCDLAPGKDRTASDWQRCFDLGRQFKFPEHVTQTSLRPSLFVL